MSAKKYPWIPLLGNPTSACCVLHHYDYSFKLPIDSYFRVVSVLLLSVSILSIDCIILIPSGKLSHNFGKSPFFMGKLTISMAIYTIAMYHDFSNFPLIFRLPVLQFFPVSELARESPDDFHLMKYKLLDIFP